MATSSVPAAGAMLGRYQVLKPLAKGGMAEVLLARTIGIKGFERHVVIKRTRVENPDQKAIDMFLDEARLVASLHHRNIVQVHDVGEEGGNYFFAMEYVHGKDARELLRHVKEKKQQVPLEHVITIVTAAAAGLHYAHEQRGPDRKPLGIVHRDISPGNILIGFDGGVKVVDFGIAKTEVRSAETQVGELKGKLGYMSPEQCRTQAVDRRTDVFLLGIVLWELCTVRRLFKADSRYEMMEAIVDGKIPPASKFRKDIPDDLDKIITKALSIGPDDRYQTADELRLVLEAFARRNSLQISPAHLSDYLKEEFGEVAEPWLTEDGPPRLDEATAAEVIRKSHPTLPAKSEEPASNETPMAWPSAPEVSSKKLVWIVGTVLGLGAAGALLMFAFKQDTKPTPKREPVPVVAPVEMMDAAVAEPVAVETPDAAVQETPVDAGVEVAAELPDAGVAVAAKPEKPKKPSKRPRPRTRPDKPDKPDVTPDKPPKPDDLDSPFPDCEESSMRTPFASLLVLVLALAPVFAQDAPKPPTKAQKAEAKKLAEEATKLYNVQQYDKAAELYQQAYLIDPKPGYLYATAQSQRLYGACDKALLSYEAYLRTNPGEAEAAKAQTNIDRCKQEIADKEAAVQAEQVKPVEEVPAPPPPPPPPPKVEPPPPPPPPTKSYVLGHLMVGLGAVALGGGVYFLREGRTAIEDHNNASTYQEFLDGRADMDAAKQKQMIGVAAIAGGAALLAGGVAFYVWRAKTPLDEEPPPVSATVTTQQAMLWFGRSF